jgi:hypothetical protein
MEAMMASSMHFYLNWTKERIDEMDATLASLEAKASEVRADSKAKADQLIADLKKRRDEFQATAKKQAEASKPSIGQTRRRGTHLSVPLLRRPEPAPIGRALDPRR